MRLSFPRAGDWVAPITLVILILVVARFAMWTPTAYHGDDLGAYLHFLDGRLASTLPQALFQEWSGKYRPVVTLLLWGLFSTVGEHPLLIVVVSYALHVACGLVFFDLARRIAGGAFLLPLVATSAFVCARFGLFNFNVIGSVESIPLLLSLIATNLSLALFADRDGRTNVNVAFLILCYAGSIFSHERYLALLPWCVLVLVISPIVRAQRRTLVIALAALLAITAINLGYKQWLGLAAVMGTGGRPIGFDPALWGYNLSTAIPSLFGINSGHPFWVGPNVEPGSFAGFCAAVFIALLLSLLALAFRARKVVLPSPYGAWIGLVALQGALVLIPPLISDPFQHRWLLHPIGMILLIVVWLASRHPAPLARVVGVAAMAAYAAGDIAITSHRYDDFIVAHAVRVSSALAQIAPAIPPGPVSLIGTQNSWVFLEGDFFRYYGGERREITYYGWTDLWLNDPAGSTTAYEYDPVKNIFRLVQRVPGT